LRKNGKYWKVVRRLLSEAYGDINPDDDSTTGYDASATKFTLNMLSVDALLLSTELTLWRRKEKIQQYLSSWESELSRADYVAWHIVQDVVSQAENEVFYSII